MSKKKYIARAILYNFSFVIIRELAKRKLNKKKRKYVYLSVDLPYRLLESATLSDETSKNSICEESNVFAKTCFFQTSVHKKSTQERVGNRYAARYAAAVAVTDELVFVKDLALPKAVIIIQT